MFKLQCLYFLILYKIFLPLGTGAYEGVKPSFTISPDVVQEGKSFTMTCKPYKPIFVTFLHIRKMWPTFNGRVEHIASALLRDGHLNVTAKDKSRITASGGIVDKFISVTISPAECIDMGEYNCKTSYQENHKQYDSNTTAALKVEGVSQTCSNVTFTIKPVTLALLSNETEEGKEVNMTCKMSKLIGPTRIKIYHVAQNKTLVTSVYGFPLENPSVTVSKVAGVSAAGKISDKIAVATFKAKCSDGGEYCCRVVYNDPGLISNGEVNQKNTLTVKVSPEKISLHSEPNNSVYVAGTKLKLTCKAIVGTVKENEKVEWFWEYKSKTDNAWKTYWNESSITAGQTELKPCYQKQTSILNHRVTVEDHGREYRCLYNVGTERYENLAANFTIKTVKGVGDTDSKNKSSGGVDDSNNESSGEKTGGGTDKTGQGSSNKKESVPKSGDKQKAVKKSGQAQASKARSSGVDDDDDDTTVATIAIAVVGTVLLVGLAGGVFFMVTRRNRPAAAEPRLPAETQQKYEAPGAQNPSETPVAQGPSEAPVASDTLSISQSGELETSEDDTTSLSESRQG